MQEFLRAVGADLVALVIFSIGWIALSDDDDDEPRGSHKNPSDGDRSRLGLEGRA